jgi:hypothetical protein
MAVESEIEKSTMEYKLVPMRVLQTVNHLLAPTRQDRSRVWRMLEIAASLERAAAPPPLSI